MTGLELVNEEIKKVSNAIIKRFCVNGYETEAQMEAYLDGIQYATDTLKKDEPKGKILDDIFTPREYLERITGDYILTKYDTCEEVETILEEFDLCIWSYCLSDIDEAIRNNKEICLVELCDDDDYTNHYYRWFEYKPIEDSEIESFVCPDCGKTVSLEYCKTDKWWDDEGNHRIIYICDCGYENYDLD